MLKLKINLLKFKVIEELILKNVKIVDKYFTRWFRIWIQEARNLLYKGFGS